VLNVISPSLSLFRVTFGGIIVAIAADVLDSQSIMRPKRKDEGRSIKEQSATPVHKAFSPHGILLGVSQYHHSLGTTPNKSAAGDEAGTQEEPVAPGGPATGPMGGASAAPAMSPASVAHEAAKSTNYSSLYASYAAAKFMKPVREKDK
jgi:hypothetical protein